MVTKKIKSNIIESQATSYYYWNKEIPQETCQQLIGLAKENWSSAVIGTEFKESPFRKSDIAWINDQWVYDLIWPYMTAANEEGGYKYNISAAQPCQVTRYTKDGFYTWHKDGMGTHREIYVGDDKFLHGNARKLSMSIILNNDYEGGDFEIRGDFDIKKVPRLEEGSIIVFPAFMDHRVTPITKGIRYSLVSWFVGLPFV